MLEGFSVETAAGMTAIYAAIGGVVLVAKKVNLGTRVAAAWKAFVADVEKVEAKVVAEVKREERDAKIAAKVVENTVDAGTVDIKGWIKTEAGKVEKVVEKAAGQVDAAAKVAEVQAAPVVAAVETAAAPVVAAVEKAVERHT